MVIALIVEKFGPASHAENTIGLDDDLAYLIHGLGRVEHNRLLGADDEV